MQRRSGPKAAPTNLGDDGDLEAKVMEPDFGNVNPVNKDLSFRCLFDPKQAEHQRGLPGPRPSDDAHLQRAESRERTACSRSSCKGPSLPSWPSPSQEELNTFWGIGGCVGSTGRTFRKPSQPLQAETILLMDLEEVLPRRIPSGHTVSALLPSLSDEHGRSSCLPQLPCCPLPPSQCQEASSLPPSILQRRGCFQPPALPGTHFLPTVYHDGDVPQHRVHVAPVAKAVAPELHSPFLRPAGRGSRSLRGPLGL